MKHKIKWSLINVGLLTLGLQIRQSRRRNPSVKFWTVTVCPMLYMSRNSGSTKLGRPFARRSFKFLKLQNLGMLSLMIFTSRCILMIFHCGGELGKSKRRVRFLVRRAPSILFRNVQFDALYNRDQFVEIRAFGDPTHVVDITEQVEIDVTFTYSVIWNESSAKFENRMDRHTRASVVPIRQQTHWFSFINSIVIIVLLMGLLDLLFMLRLKNDMRKCADSNGDEEEVKKVSWKCIHGDVFRCPPHLSLFCAALGTGTQLLILVFVLFLLAFLGVLYPYNRGALFEALVFVYSITSAVAGYTAASFHNQFADSGWEGSVRLAGFLYLGPFFVMVSILNTVAVSYGATAGLPFSTIMVILLVCTLVAIPLLALGGVIGHRWRSEFQATCATKRFHREIPPLAWYRKTPWQMFVAGLVSFSAIVLELHHLYASLWGYKIYTLASILLITFIILLILTSMLSVSLTYIQLSAEDHE
ncbi:putative phagocytic receptor 1b [Morella rubra]|uniref:Transmembrane 9 superfamily member n=1 Tax=Morella rubra TaxID=262757 RepID=A0A6A1WPJ5_9ROSI|nr:putative phagocytic receptor 1b [Morella rubra]